MYSKVSNKDAAHLINFSENSNLHNLIPSCTCITYWKKFLPALLFHPAFSSLLKNFDHFTKLNGLI